MCYLSQSNSTKLAININIAFLTWVHGKSEEFCKGLKLAIVYLNQNTPVVKKEWPNTKKALLKKM